MIKLTMLVLPLLTDPVGQVTYQVGTGCDGTLTGAPDGGEDIHLADGALLDVVGDEFGFLQVIVPAERGRGIWFVSKRCFDPDDVAAMERALDEAAKKAREEVAAKRREERRAYLRAEGFTSKEISLILDKKVAIGMRARAVRESWGEPDDVNRTITASSTREQWVYGRGVDSQYLYMEDGELTAIQD